MTPEKRCTKCGLIKNSDEFNFKDKASGIRRSRCRGCTRKETKKHYLNNTEYYIKKATQESRDIAKAKRFRQQVELIIIYLLEHPCVDCGEADIVCLEFDHVRDKKFRSVSQMIGNFSWPRIEAEIEKCEVRCANCHRIKTAKQFNYWSAEYI